jgi:hypothetical protein
MVETTETLIERRLREKLPSGFVTTLSDEGHLRTLANQSTDNINETVQEFSGQALTEKNIIDVVIERVLTGSFLTPERTIELPGLGIEYNAGRLYSWAASYKASDDTPTGTIADAQRAQSDDLVFTFAGPEVYNQIGNSSVDNFKTSGHTAGDVVTLVGEDGYNSSADAVLDLDEDERLFFTGDFVDVSSGKSVFNSQEYVQVDGSAEDYGPQRFLLSNRLSGANVSLGSGARVKRDVQLNLKAYEDGDAEVWPIAFYMAPGYKAPSL